MSERRFRRTAAGVYSLGLHRVWCPKYGRRIVGARVAARCDEHGWQISAKELLPDHVHVFVQVGPTDAPAVLRAFKGRTARMLRHEFPCSRRFALDWPFTQKPREKKPTVFQPSEKSLRPLAYRYRCSQRHNHELFGATTTIRSANL